MHLLPPFDPGCEAALRSPFLLYHGPPAGGRGGVATRERFPCSVSDAAVSDLLAHVRLRRERIRTRDDLEDPLRDRLRVRVRGLVGEAREFAAQLEAAEAERSDALPAHADPADLLALRAELALQRQGAPQDLRVEGPCEPAVTGQRRDCDGAHL